MEMSAYRIIRHRFFFLVSKKEITNRKKNPTETYPKFYSTPTKNLPKSRLSNPSQYQKKKSPTAKKILQRPILNSTVHLQKTYQNLDCPIRANTKKC